MKRKRMYRAMVLPLSLTAQLIAALFLSLSHGLWAAETDLKPGDTVGPHNWQRVHGMVGENLLNRIKQGYTVRIKQGRFIDTPK